MHKTNKVKLKNVGLLIMLRNRKSKITEACFQSFVNLAHQIRENRRIKLFHQRYSNLLASERGDVPGWVLVVLMTTGLVTAIWTIAAPRLTSILKNSLDAMNGIR